MRTRLFFAEPAIKDGLVGINAPVAQEGPIATSLFAPGGIAFDHENLLLAVGRFRNYLAERVGHEGVAPKLQPGITVLRMPFESNPVDHRGVHTIGNRMTALNGFPGLELRRAKLRFLVRMPADAGGIKNDLGAAEGREA